jgi:23S rRNA (adenine2503-C2)-methyltransferase
MIFDYSYPQLEELLVSLGEKPYRARQIYEWLYQHKVTHYDQMTNLPQSLRDQLNEVAPLAQLALATKQVSADGTQKYLFRLHDGHLIESVLMDFDYGQSICITTQVGCNIGCSFCASGLLGKKRDLTSGEIVAQVLEVERLAAVRVGNIVVMGIGEPFDNFTHLMNALYTINHPWGLNIGARHVTVSTSGIVPMIYKFADLKTQFNLALSLHAPNNELRTKLMKINKAYPLKEVMDAVRYYVATTNRRITFEYIMLKDQNDFPILAHELSDLIRGINGYVNLIPYNSVTELAYQRSEKNAMVEFYDILKKRGITATLRVEKGHDIAAACGQLRSVNL